MKRFKHPQHGYTHSNGQLHEAALRAAGWVEDAPEVPAVAPGFAEAQQVRQAQMNRLAELAVFPKRKPGRPKKVQQ